MEKHEQTNYEEMNYCGVCKFWYHCTGSCNCTLNAEKANNTQQNTNEEKPVATSVSAEALTGNINNASLEESE